jgi:hypothetical protein
MTLRFITKVDLGYDKAHLWYPAANPLSLLAAKPLHHE